MAGPSRGRGRRSLPSLRRSPHSATEGNEEGQSRPAPVLAAGSSSGTTDTAFDSGLAHSDRNETAEQTSTAAPSRLPASHSYPFLAAPPPDRVFTRRLRRRSSTPTASSSSSSAGITRREAGATQEQMPTSSSGSVSGRKGHTSRSTASSGVGISPSDAVTKVSGAGDPAASASTPSHRRSPSSSPPTSPSSSRPKRRRPSRRRSLGASTPRSPPPPTPTYTRSASGSLSGLVQALEPRSVQQAMDFSHRRYELVSIQEPTDGSAFGSNLLSRLPLAPPLILRLRVFDTRDGRELPSDVEGSWLLCQVQLTTESGQTADMISSLATTTTQGEVAASAPVSETRQKRRRDSADTAGDEAGGSSVEGGTSTSAATSGSVTSPPVRRSSRQIARSTAAATASSSSPPPTQAVVSGSAGAGTAENTDASGPVSTSSPSGILTHPLRMLYGSLTASPQVFRSTDGPLATFFFFPEVCVRVRGRYRLRATLLRLPSSTSTTSVTAAADTNEPTSGDASTSQSASAVLATIQTSPFNVQLASEYIAPYVTDLTRHFARQGAALPLPQGEHTD